MVAIAKGNPTPNITWHKDGAVLENNDTWHIDLIKDDQGQQVTSILQVKSVMLSEHEGKLNVMAENEVGSISHDTEIIGKLYELFL